MSSKPRSRTLELAQARALVAMDQLDSIWEPVALAEDALRMLEGIWGKAEELEGKPEQDL